MKITGIEALDIRFPTSRSLDVRLDPTLTYTLAEQRALEHAGFVREGVLRGRGFVRGEWQDGVLYARLRGDPVP